MNYSLFYTLASAVTLVTAASVQADSIVLNYSDANGQQTATCEVEGGVINFVPGGGLAATCSQFSISGGGGDPSLDSDDDGVPDSIDLCPDTPLDESAEQDGDAIGCSAEDQAVDTDGDGVADYIDQCPSSDLGVIVSSNGCGPGEDAAWGETLVDGIVTPVTWAEEISGLIDTTVYYPSMAFPELIIYEGVLAREIIYPGCADMGSIPTDEWLGCGFAGSLDPDTVIAQRIRAGGTDVAFLTNDTGDQLNNYDVRVTSYPLPEELDDPGLDIRGSDTYYCGKTGTGGYGVNINAESASAIRCDVSLTENSYALFRPAGPDAAQCNEATFPCRMRIFQR